MPSGKPRPFTGLRWVVLSVFEEEHDAVMESSFMSFTSNNGFGPGHSSESGASAVLDRPENLAAIDEIVARAASTEYQGDAGESSGEAEQEASAEHVHQDAPVAVVEAPEAHAAEVEPVTPVVESTPVVEAEVVPEVVEVEDDRVTFASLGLSEALLESIASVGYEVPSPIQERTIPVLLEGRDVIAQAETGSGKTAAFGLPIIETVQSRRGGVQALVLCPTRELAIQVSEALAALGRHKRIETLPIYGGQAYDRQLRGLQRGVEVVVGTPGRVMDHMRRGTLNLDNLKYFVLDEADEMLDMGFVDDIEWILQQVPQERQTALFSATMPQRIAELARKYMNEPQRISVRGKEMTVAAINQVYYEIPRQRKIDALTRILEAEVPSSAIIFCRTKHGVDDLGEALMARGFAVDTLHGDLSQVQRDRVMKRFRSGQADILIATDVAARGLDVDDVSHVVNFDIPESTETYVHRIGRTGRAGKTGTAITLVTPRESRWIRSIERFTKATIQPKRLPTAKDVNERRREVLKTMVLDVLKDEESFNAYLEPVRDLAKDHDGVDIAAAILKLYATETGRSTTETQKDDDVASYSGSFGGRNDSGMVRLFVNIGRNFHVRPQDLVGAIANEANVPGRSIGAIDILDTYSFVDVPKDSAQRVIDALNNASVKGRPVNVELSSEPAASGRRDRDDRGPRGGGGGYRSGQRSGGQSRGPRSGPYGQRPQGGGGRRDENRSGGGFNRGPASERRGPRRDARS